MKHKLTAADLLLLITTLIWGWTFIIVKWSVQSIDPYFFIFSRFFLAFLLLSALFHPKIKSNWRTCIKPGLFLGTILALAFIFQTLGLKYTTASASGFITGLSVVLVTVFAAIINRRLPQRLVFFGILAATFGLLLITFKGSLEFEKGDLLTLACAVLFALHVVYTERFAADLPASVLTLIQFATVAFLSGVAYLFFGEKTLIYTSFSGMQWLAVLYCGILATAVAYLFQTKAQQKIPAFRAAVLLATEPLFAGIFAVGLRIDPFEWKVVVGGFLILLGMILTGWGPGDQQTIPPPEIMSISPNKKDQI